MFTKFIGFHLVEDYHKWKEKRRTERHNYAVGRTVKLTVVALFTLVLWFLPPSLFGIPDLTVVEQRLIAIFAFATLMWILEAVPSWTTSVFVVVLLLLTVSDSSLRFMVDGYPP